tara:strand:+ start:4840 stop:4998 length:159 start_codon:yes stop_codon:yes gene_type:complete
MIPVPVLVGMLSCDSAESILESIKKSRNITQEERQELVQMVEENTKECPLPT